MFELRYYLCIAAQAFCGYTPFVKTSAAKISSIEKSYALSLMSGGQGGFVTAGAGAYDYKVRLHFAAPLSAR